MYIQICIYIYINTHTHTQHTQYIHAYTDTYLYNYRDNKDKYDYQCMKPVEGEIKQCSTLHTPLNERLETKGLEFLDRHDVNCRKDEVLQAFHLQVLL